MATKTFSSEFIASLAQNSIDLFFIKRDKRLLSTQRRAIHNFRKKLFSRLFRANWDDTQIKEKLLSHTKKCYEMFCNIDYPIISFAYSSQILQLVRIRDLAIANKEQGEDYVTISDEEWDLLKT